MDFTKPILLKQLNCDIGLNRIVEVQCNEASPFFEIVSFDKSPSGNYSRSAKKSLIFNLENLKVIIDNIDIIKQNFELAKISEEVEYKLHLGELLFLRIDKGIKCVDFRRHFIPKGNEHIAENLSPGLPGVGMKFIEFGYFLELIDTLVDLTQINQSTTICEKETHKKETCKICNPQKLFFKYY